MFPNLEAELARKKITKDKIAKLLGVRYATVIDKTRGRSRFFLAEAIEIRNNFFPDCTLEYLFEEEEVKRHEYSG